VFPLAAIRVRRKNNASRIALFLIVVVAILAVGGYFVLKTYRVKNSETFKAEKIDYLIHVDESIGGNESYVLMRTRSNGKIFMVKFPKYLSLGQKEILGEQESLSDVMRAIYNWLGIKADISFYFSLDDTVLKDLSNSLGFFADNFDDFLDGVSRRGFNFSDYWKLDKYRKILSDAGFETNLTAEGIAAFIERVSNSRFYEFKLETLTDHPIQVYVNNAEPKKVLYISTESIKELKNEILEW